MRELVVLILLCAAEASVFGRFQTATIFGNILGQSKEEQQQPQPPPHHHQLQLQRPPFPPPPPRPPYTSNSLEDQQQQRPPPPPPPPHLQRGDQEAHHLYHQLQESLAQQHALALQTQNLTALVVDLEAREELHVRQLDVLTETVMQVEALLAHERNALQEAKANYSQATQLVAQLQADVETLTQKCNEYEQQADADQAKIVQLKQALKEAKHEAEDLAALIERHRIDRQQEQEQFKRRQKPKRGFWAWLFGRAKDDAYVDDDSLEAAYEQARTSLLKALQTERQNVDELESIVANLQQNNSAISEQLTSQDLIIEELNDRISVFEEDKVVLKAALKQLQVELNQEAPKTQALKTDLKRANERVTKLQAQLNETRVAHDKQVKDLEHKIAAKEIAFQQADANLTMIGTYVDRLEGRLADFALARKTIDQREAAVSELEAQVEAAKQERDAVRKQVSELETELQELKALLKEMAEERRTLKSDIDSLQSERDALSVGQEKLRQSLAQLENDYASLQQAHTELQQSLQGNETSRTAQYENELADSESRVQELSSQLQNAVWERRDLTERLSDTEEVNLQLRERIVELEEAKRKLTEEYQSQLEEARKAVEVCTKV